VDAYDTILCEKLDSINAAIRVIEENVRHYEVFNVDTTSLIFWATIIGLILSEIAAYFGYKGYVYQKEATNSLKSLSERNVPFEELILLCQHAFVHLLAIRYVQGSLGKTPNMRALENITLPENLLDISIYQNDVGTYRKALRLKMAIRDYNNSIDYLTELLEQNKDVDKVDKKIWTLCLMLDKFR